MTDRTSAWTSAFSEARWLNQKRVITYSRLFLAVYAITIIFTLVLSRNFIDPQGKPVGTDFICFWTAGRIALDGHAVDVYNFNYMFAMEQKMMPWGPGQKTPLLPWLYPPVFLFAAAALAFLPYGAALGAWTAATLPLYLASVRSILPGKNAIPAALAFPAAFTNLVHGQNGFLTAGLLGGALVLLARSPWLAGVLFGLLAYKPQLALLIPLALLVGGYWRTMLAAAVTAVLFIGLSWAVFGSRVWPAFFASLPTTRLNGLENGAAGWGALQSLFSAVRMYGGSVELAYWLQGVLAILTAVALVWIWLKPVSASVKCAALPIAMLLATPYVLDYDLTLLALPIAWIAGIGLREGFLPWEKITLFAAWLLPLLAHTMGKFLRLPLAPFVMALLLAITIRRALSDLTVIGNTAETSFNSLL